MVLAGAGDNGWVRLAGKTRSACALSSMVLQSAVMITAGERHVRGGAIRDNVKRACVFFLIFFSYSVTRTYYTYTDGKTLFEQMVGIFSLFILYTYNVCVISSRGYLCVQCVYL